MERMERRGLGLLLIVIVAVMADSSLDWTMAIGAVLGYIALVYGDSIDKWGAK